MQMVICLVIISIVTSLGYEDLSIYKSASQSSTSECSNPCNATTAVDGSLTTCMKTLDIGGSATFKSVLWNVDLGDINSIYSIRIQFKDYGAGDKTIIMRQQGRFAGFSLYVSNSTNKENGYRCYKDGPELPSLDFNITCVTHGRFVIFYNERLNGITYPTEYQTSNVFTELCEVTVTGCMNTSTYGYDCDLQCPENCQERRCYIVNGSCLGCRPGWTGKFCNNYCPAGFYGLECRTPCTGQCRDNKPCNHITGDCDEGCTDGWTGSDCSKECPAETYGPDCIYNCSGHCVNGAPCNRTTGSCDSGCEPGYTEEHCDKACSIGFYGLNCTKQCNNHCRYGMNHCNHKDGHCELGCQDGFQGIICSETCNSGSFGIECAKNCSEKCHDVCNHIDGSCLCSEGWMGSPNCDKECLFGRNCRNKCSENCKNKSCNMQNGTCTYGCVGSFEGSKCDRRKSSQQDDAVKPAAVGGAVGTVTLLFIMVTAGLVIIRWRRRKRDRSNEETNINEFSFVDEPFTKDENIQDMEMNDGVENPLMNLKSNRQARKPEIENSVAVTDLYKIILDLSENENNRLKEEYRAIPNGELHACNEGKKPVNASKNRYTTIFPYDHSRVVLQVSEKQSDYINANYIQDTYEKKSYIATQGPISKTIADFWKMVWGEEISVIICLTNINDGGRSKCVQYWPASHNKTNNGDISVRNQEEKSFADFVVRHFRLQNSSEQKERDVFMFHYTQWSDHDVPEPLSLVIFHRHVMRISNEHPGKYTLVHCSAGIGRTGTYIALDALYKKGDKTGKINVPKYVEAMRKDRMNMIQGVDQYKVVYLALLEAFRGKSRSISRETFLQEFQEHSCYINLGEVANKSPLSAEYQELVSIQKKYTSDDYKSGRTFESANYSPSVLPVERYTCFLTNTDGKNIYYNAVSIQSFTRSDHIISAQYPLPDYTEDFLRLVKGYYTPTIVSLYPLVEIESSSLWFPAGNDKKQVGPFTVKLTDCTQLETVKKTNIVLQQKGFSSMRVSVLECKGWKGENEKSNGRVLIDIIKEAKIEDKTHPDGKILILSSDGAKRCGPFCVIYNALEQMTVDNEVDIFTITRQLQIRRPEFICSLEEYQVCYDTVADYLQTDMVYANC